jgi:hypothetical protein
MHSPISTGPTCTHQYNCYFLTIFVLALKSRDINAEGTAGACIHTPMQKINGWGSNTDEQRLLDRHESGDLERWWTIWAILVRCKSNHGERHAEIAERRQQFLDRTSSKTIVDMKKPHFVRTSFPVGIFFWCSTETALWRYQVVWWVISIYHDSGGGRVAVSLPLMQMSSLEGQEG